MFTDFDDTIAHDASSDMGPEGFNRLVGPRTTKQHFAFNVLKNAASKLDKNKRNKVGIVTARHKSVIPHLRKWLHDKEVPNAEKIKIHAVGHLTNPLPADEIARRKVKAIGSHVRKGEIRKGDEVHFFDDAKPNVDAVASMRHKGVRVRSVGVGPGRKKLKEQGMNYGRARQLMAEAITMVGEALVDDPVTPGQGKAPSITPKPKAPKPTRTVPKPGLWNIRTNSFTPIRPTVKPMLQNTDY